MWPGWQVVYRFGAGQERAAIALSMLLRSRGLCPDLTLDGGDVVILLLPDDAAILRLLQARHPERFGGC